jgi:hypothetical protein
MVDHEFYHLVVNGSESSVFTKMSHAPKSTDIGHFLIKKMSDQMHLSKNQFLEFVDCRLSEEEYVKFLVAERRIILPSPDSPAPPS